MQPRERPKKGVKLNIPPDLYAWVRRFEFDSSISKTRLGIAAFAAFGTYSDAEQRKLLQWASLLDEEKVTWAEFLAAAQKKQRERDAALKAAVDRVLRYELEESQLPRRSRRPGAS